MDHDAQLKLQAYLDGELSETEARKVASWIEKDQDAAALFAELSFTHQDLAQQEQAMLLPESREFFWSKIEREILRQERPPLREKSVPWWVAWRRVLVPVGGAAGLVLAGLIAGGFIGGSSAPQMETATADSGAFTYHDYDAGTTLVWLSYPAENEFAESLPAATIQ